MSDSPRVQRIFLDALYGHVKSDALLAEVDEASRHRAVVYAEGLRARFSESLIEAYPRTSGNLADTWEELVAHYAFSHPSPTWDLGRIGAAFPEFLAKRPEGQKRSWLPELARLERMLHELFFLRDDGAVADFPTDEEALAEWRPKFSPTLQLLRVDAKALAVFAGQEPTGTGMGQLLAYRTADGIGDFHRLTPEQFTLQAALLAGESFASAAEQSGVSPEGLSDLCGFWVRAALLR